jgi:hypothetical protein
MARPLRRTPHVHVCAFALAVIFVTLTAGRTPQPTSLSSWESRTSGKQSRPCVPRALPFGVIHVSDELAVVGDATSLRALPFVRYVEQDPPDAVWTQVDTLEYGVANTAAALWLHPTWPLQPRTVLPEDEVGQGVAAGSEPRSPEHSRSARAWAAKPGPAPPADRD